LEFPQRPWLRIWEVGATAKPAPCVVGPYAPAVGVIQGQGLRWAESSTHHGPL